MLIPSLNFNRTSVLDLPETMKNGAGSFKINYSVYIPVGHVLAHGTGAQGTLI